MATPSMLEGRNRESDAPSPLAMRFESAEEFHGQFREDIGMGALFLPTLTEYAPKQAVEVTFDLAFCGEGVALPAEVVAVVDPALAEVGATIAGISVRFKDSASALRERLEGLTGLDLGEPLSSRRSERRKKERFSSDADVVVATPNGEFSGRNANISYTGVLALLPMTSIPVGTDVRVHLSNPRVELNLSVDGRIIHSRRCDGGVIAHGIQLQYPVDRIDEVMAFIEFLQSFDRARRLATVSGKIDASGLESVLEMFVQTAPSGTLVVSRGEDEGKIVFSENYILRCTVGMVSGMKALARMFCWSEGSFEFHHDLQLPEMRDDAQPFEAAMMMASVQRDEMARIGFDALGADDGFLSHPDRLTAGRDSLSELEREVLDCAADGFNAETICDMIPAPDADILKALVALLDAGAIEPRR
jgi:hypothetical protein